MYKLKGLDRALEQERGMAWMLLAARDQDAGGARWWTSARERPSDPRDTTTNRRRRLVEWRRPSGTRARRFTGNRTRARRDRRVPCWATPPPAATTLRRAAGLYKHAPEKVLPSAYEELDPERPNELVPSMADRPRVCLAEAQAATARRAEERVTGGDLIAKLHLGAHELYKRADRSSTRIYETITA